MTSNQERTSRGLSANSNELRQVFVARVHQLIYMGHERLRDRDLSKTAEPAITGHLVKAIESVLDDPPTEIGTWCHHIDVHDDPPENVGEREGKNRRRVDIKFVSMISRPRDRFRLEAKRLASGKHNIAAFLGDDGLGCFLDGDYGPLDVYGGMLAYVQQGVCKEWAANVRRELTANDARYGLTKDEQWCSCATSLRAINTFTSCHNRRCDSSSITIYHTFLSFVFDQKN